MKKIGQIIIMKHSLSLILFIGILFLSIQNQVLFVTPQQAFAACGGYSGAASCQQGGCGPSYQNQGRLTCQAGWFCCTPVTCSMVGGSCSPNLLPSGCGANNHSIGNYLCSTNVNDYGACCIRNPNCNTRVVCNGWVNGGNECSSNDDSNTCYYTGYTGGQKCIKTYAYTLYRTTNNCAGPRYRCVPSVPGVCDPFWTLTGRVTDPLNGGGVGGIGVGGIGGGGNGGTGGAGVGNGTGLPLMVASGALT